MTDLDTITRELNTPPVGAPPLDPTLFNPSDVELQFLRSAISEDDEELRARILEVQKEFCPVSEEYPYPCIRAFHFIWLMMSKNPAYAKVIKTAQQQAHAQQHPVFLDLGCCMGSDVRKLAQDGYPATSIVGCDIRSPYLALGHKLFGDSPSSLGIHFITGDIFNITPHDTSSKPEATLDKITSLNDLRGRVTYLYTGALFHLFDELTQLAIARRLAILLNREKDAVIFGRHQGLVEEAMIDDHMGRKRYGHSPISWARMWKHVFTESDGNNFVESRLEVKAELSSATALHGIPIEHRQLTWSVHL
ncbi:hypothetical protein K439DRAFT_1345845 [Ramaria rubella]|nr:hypothetical protein K439DRAFT_1345845 [Ramaria rubella]